LWISPAASPVPADRTSGLHFGFAAPDEAAMRAHHVASLQGGGQDNSGPGVRPPADRPEHVLASAWTEPGLVFDVPDDQHVDGRAYLGAQMPAVWIEGDQL